MFRALDAGLIRATARAGASPLPPLPTPDRTDDTSAAAQREWIRLAWCDAAFAEAIETASPALAERIEAVLAGRVVDAAQIRRVAFAILRYDLRFESRATPFGLFAGVAPVRFADSPEVVSGAQHRALARPEALRLRRATIPILHSLLRDMTVLFNNLASAQGGRLVVLGQAEHNELGSAAVSLRHTPATAAVQRLASAPIRYADLAAKLTAEFPTTPETTVEAMLRALVGQGVLLTRLQPPMSETDPLGFIADELAQSGHEIRQQMLCDGQQALQAVAAARGDAEQRATLREATRIVGQEGDRPALAVDLALDLNVALPPDVIAEAEHAADALLRLTPFPSGFGAWADYHHRFLERYGLGAAVPVREVIDPVAGQGFPAGFRDSLLPQPVTVLTDRDRALIALATEAIRTGREIDLADGALDQIATETITPPPHVGITFHLRAADLESVAAGRFTLSIEGASRAVGTTEGRVLHLLDQADRDRIVQVWEHLPTTIASARRVQVSAPPLFTSTENVARVPQVIGEFLALGEYPPPSANPVNLDDLAVSADTVRLFFIDLTDGSIVEPMVPNAVEPISRMHPVQRFLAELSRARASVYTKFDWGTASALPVLPQIRLGRSILVTARWKIRAEQLPDRERPWPEWKAAWQELRGELQIPDLVYLGESDVRIRINTTDPAHQALLRRELDRHPLVIVREAPSREDFGWIDGRAHEITLPLATTTPASQRECAPRLPQPFTMKDEHLPGTGTWLYAKVYTHPERMSSLLTDHVARFAAETGLDWWFIRYLDPLPHLRVRFRLTPATGYGAATEHLGAWAQDLRQRSLIGGLQLDTYIPETGRYGHGPAMAAAEESFAADSITALAQLRHTAAAVKLAQPLLAASLIDLTVAFTGSVDAGMRWLLEHVDRTGPPLDRTAVTALAGLLDPHASGRTLLTDSPSGSAVVDAWTRRAGAVGRYRSALAAAEHPTDPVLSALLHLHHIRAVGIDPGSEQAALKLARTAALAWHSRNRRSPS
ncbi:thiopeptide-type bacteriocin biosynthesis domain-containing protein [Glycomyces harbinensis]|uniref:Thiopeptide-type bacteriocin biosynthesis domain-containing protein n=2 Tax=Glycomyces harbinensis TaxID=58114 RepID=A0A1G6Y9E0_9ACTN|nr:thiopeptide-type bacteriocin biosynthesis domain-containing protein [Glycomyces harbinensis]